MSFLPVLGPETAPFSILSQGPVILLLVEFPSNLWGDMKTKENPKETLTLSSLLVETFTPSTGDNRRRPTLWLKHDLDSKYALVPYFFKQRKQPDCTTEVVAQATLERRVGST